MTPSDSVLIARTLESDDRAAFGELVRRHQSAVRRFLRHLTRHDAALADDLAQETFIQAYRGLAGFRGEASLPTWLLGIAHNHWRNACRRRRDEVAWDEAIGAVAADGDPARDADLRHDLALALHHLSAEEQLALHLTYQQGLSHREISALLDWPLGTVKTHLARSKATLRHHLATWNLPT